MSTEQGAAPVAQHDKWEALARGLYGLQPVAAVPCLRWAAGGRCQGAGSTGRCEDCGAGPLRAHPRAWRALGWRLTPGPRVVLWEPDVDPWDPRVEGAWTTLLARAAGWGLRARRLPASPWNFLDGYAIAIHRPGVVLVGDVLRGGGCAGRSAPLEVAS